MRLNRSLLWAVCRQVPQTLFAQSCTIIGSITDASGGVIARATVTITNHKPIVTSLPDRGQSAGGLT